MDKLKYDINNMLITQKRCNDCLEDFENGDEIIRYTEITNECGDYLGQMDYEEREYFFCSSACMLNHIINGDNVRHFKIELYDSEDKENLKLINDIKNEIRNIKCDETKIIHDIEIFTFEKNDKINYLINDNMWGSNLEGVIDYVIKILRNRGVVK